LKNGNSQLELQLLNKAILIQIGSKKIIKEALATPGVEPAPSPYSLRLPDGPDLYSVRSGQPILME